MIATQVKPAAAASSAAASSSRVLPMPGSPSRVTAARRLGLPQLLGDRVELGAPPDDRALRPAQLDRERALGPDERVERTPATPDGRSGLD